MFEFLNLNPEPFGLDINDLSLKVIKLEKKHGFWCPVCFGEKKMPKGIIKDGVIEDEIGLVKNIKKVLDCVRGEKLKTKYVVASLPEEKSFSQVIRMPRMSDAELESAVPIEAENYIPLPVNQMYLDFKRIESAVDNAQQLDIFIIAVEKTLVDSYVSVLNKAGLIPVALEVETQAIARALIKSEIFQAPVAIVDFGGDSADFIVFSGNSVRFTSSIPVSSRQITEAISKNLGITFKEAEHMKIKYGFSSNNKTNHRAKAVSRAVEPILENLTLETKKYIDFYSSHNSHEPALDNSGKKNKIQKLILSGGGAKIKGLDEFFKKNLNIAVELGDPWINFSKTFERPGLVDLKNKSLSFTTAIGLALRDLDREYD